MCDKSGMEYDGVSLEPKKNLRNREVRGERRFHYQTALLLESVRRQTFTSWTVAFVDPDQLAAAGFFYLRTQDHVQCVFCQGIVGYWDPGDLPLVEHRKHFPNCPFITGVPTGNVPLPSSESDPDQARLYRLLDNYHTFKVACTRPAPPSSPYQTDSVRVGENGSGVAFPQLNTTPSRLQTYGRWPQGVGVSPDVLAEAGFFSTGLADWVQCFYCGGGLFGWRQGDDPKADHTAYFPFCPFIRMLLGGSVPANPPCKVPQPASRPPSLSDAEVALLLHHPIAKRLVGMGLSTVTVREALRQRLTCRGVLCRSVTEALELVFDYEEDQRKNDTNPSAAPVSSPQEGQPCQSQNQSSGVPMQTDTMQNFSQPATNPDTYNPHVNSYYTKLQQEVQGLREQVRAEEAKLLCRSCRRERVAVAFQPCGHLHLCAECARPRDTCLTCGVVVRGTFRPIIG